MEEEQSFFAQSKINPTPSNASEGDEEGFVDALNEGTGNFSVDKEGSNSLGSRKLTSEAWTYFDQVLVNNVKKAKCKGCNKLLSATSNYGTSHLMKHAKKTCTMRHLEISKGQTKLRMKTELDGSTTLELKEKYKEFNQEFSRNKLVIMVIIHEYPLSIFDHFGFKDFVKSLNPLFKMISRNTLRNDILKIYKDEKLSLKRLLEYNDSRIAVTTDMWTASNQKKGYMVVTSHFIDQNWVLRNRTLRFCFVPCPHTKGVIAKVLMDCLSQYCLESKISSVVVDNCTTNDAMMKVLLKNFEKKSLMLKGSFLHMRCSAHILNLIVQDGLEVIASGIEKVRGCVSFWMSTPKRIEKFEESCRFFGDCSPTRLVLDCKTRWNSTFYMLQSALPYKDVFYRLKRLNRRMKFDIPSEDDWKLASLICQKLVIFDKATKVFSGRHYPTSNLFFRKACEIKLALRRWLVDDVDIVKSMAKNMIEKFDKYWEHINDLLAIAAILDLRNKMDCVEHYFRRLYGEDGEREVERVRLLLSELVVEYQQRSELSEGKNNEDEIGKGNGKRMHSTSCDDDEDEYAQLKKTKKRKVNVKGEVDHYLEDRTEDEDDEFDILTWWKIDRRYPTLRKIAKDIIAIPISSVALESAFSMGGRVVSPHRSRLHANTVEALMCLQNWKMQNIQGDMKDTHAWSTINEDSDLEGDKIDTIDLDVDDIPIEDMDEDDSQEASFII
ncbi:hypothetical protein RND81_02G179500 [Saponaria officinalis]|uniref:BED-type domain-containing protein n=1 Tax=Saponaria officinalis TaxID=3572 RepID=A0AAW1MVL7_SAPOF